MRLFGQKFGREGPNVNNEAVYTLSSEDTAFLEALGISTSTIDSNKLGEITYFVCMKFLAENLGKLPVKEYVYTKKKGKELKYEPRLSRVLNIEPNPYMGASSFWQAVENNRNHYGNSYAYIERHRGIIDSLWIIPSSEVRIYVDDDGLFRKERALYYEWTDSRSNKKYMFDADEILHYKTSTTFDGIVGLAVKDILKLNLEIGQYSQAYLQKLYAGNMFGGKIILQHTGDMNKNAKDVLIREVESYANSVGSGKFLPLPLGITATAMDMKLSDAEFAALNKLNALQIASAFGIKPNILNNYEKSSYANSETQQLDFYINTLSPTLKQYKEENTRKMVFNTVLEHDVKDLFKLDPVKQMTVLQKGMNNFMYTINDAREELGKPYIDHELANVPIGNGNYKTLDQLITEIKDKEK